MDLIFSQTENRRQCESEVVIDEAKVQCTFSTSNAVTIPQGLQYLDGKLNLSKDMPASTIPICQNHAMRLKNAFNKLSNIEL